MKSLLSLTNKQIYSILKRFYTKYVSSKKNIGKTNPNKLPSNQEDIQIMEVCIFPCIYSNNENQKKENLIIKFRYKEDTISLNILLEHYKDLL